jgi:flagellar M-ring protein FliF
LDAFVQILRNIGTVRLGAMASVAIGLVAFFVYLTTRLASPNLSLLYGDLSASDSGQIIAILQTNNVPLETRNKGTEVYIPVARVGEMRLKIADQGLPGGGTIGYEIIDRQETLGSSSFVQNINRVRALEGEIARTIMSLALVKGARVHLVLPRRELFTRERQVPSASIALRMRGATRLDRSQVMAIRHLVAAAVPGLQPARISIVDDRGTLLARLGDAANPQVDNLSADEQRVAYGGDGNQSQTNRTEESTNFEISKTMKRRVRAAGAIKRLSVAVLVDGATAEGPNGEQVYTARSDNEMAQLDKLVRSAIGFNTERGDTLEIVNMRFAAPPVGDDNFGPKEIFGFKQNDLLRLAELLVLGVVGILVILLVVRPLISRIFEASATAVGTGGTGDEPQMITDQSGAMALPGPAGAVAASMPGGGAMVAGGGAEDEESMINLSNIEGRVKASSLRKIGDIIDKHPEEAVSIMRTWMYQDN